MDNEILIRLCIFFFAFAALALLERLIPRRSKENNKGLRWRTNWSFIIIDSFFLRLLAFAIPLLAIGAAADAKASGIGIFNLLEWPVGIEFVLSILILDFAIWIQHLITHKIPFLWRVHQVHHSDPEFDVSTAIRFHPIEIVLSMLFKVGLVYLL
ncbi:MAG: sterol desaturase family protein, partial [Paracoccaceae bacterium]